MDREAMLSSCSTAALSTRAMNSIDLHFEWVGVNGDIEHTRKCFCFEFVRILSQILCIYLFIYSCVVGVWEAAVLKISSCSRISWTFSRQLLVLFGYFVLLFVILGVSKNDTLYSMKAEVLARIPLNSYDQRFTSFILSVLMKILLTMYTE